MRPRGDRSAAGNLRAEPGAGSGKPEPRTGEPGAPFGRPAAQAHAAFAAAGQRHQHRRRYGGADGVPGAAAKLHRLWPRSKPGEPPGKRLRAGPHFHQPNDLRAPAAGRSGLGGSVHRAAAGQPQGLQRGREGLRGSLAVSGGGAG